MKKSDGLMDRILVFIGGLLIVFTIAMIVIFLIKDSIPDTLVTCVFGVCGGECGIMGWIHTAKLKKNETCDSEESSAELEEEEGPVG